MNNNTIIKTFNILDLISKHSDGLTLSQIYKELNYSKSTTYDILKTLYMMDAIYYKDQRIKSYVIGSKMFQIGNTYIKHSNIINASTHALKEFANSHKTIVFITKRIGNKIVYVYKYQPLESKISIPSDVGYIEYDFNNSSVGRVYTYFDTFFKGYIESEISNEGIILDEVNGSYIRTFSVPIYNFENRVCGVISSCNLTTENIEDKTLEEFKLIGSEISKKLGYIKGEI
jgi:DNA-binding IclR family transcriptional regulator